ncbi:hypothetical protein Vadar_023220 [Vaccinium darrowii]|uniref:Uncharacterized protein n=1 Tax=Vaccinium darrowii TaxID=229202 RepID=A0ACB7YQ70_9ERIC|nr:hypothetical protein Vadar_023220 [Vaccinium darrowii]
MASAMATGDQSKHYSNPHLPPPTYTHSYSNHPPPPYQSYPPPYPPINATYSYAAAPPAAYYSHPPVYNQPSNHLTVVRFILTSIFVLLICAFALSLLSRLYFGSITPQFYIKSLSVPSFNASDSTLTATWDVNVTVKNSNEKLDLYFDRLEGVIVYEEVILGVADADPFGVSTKGEVVFEMNVSTAADTQGGTSSDESYHGLVEDRRSGTVRFSLRMAAEASVRSGTVWRRELSMRVFCEDLDVKFDGPVGPGKLLENGNELPTTCVVYV